MTLLQSLRSLLGRRRTWILILGATAFNEVVLALVLWLMTGEVSTSVLRVGAVTGLIVATVVSVLAERGGRRITRDVRTAMEAAVKTAQGRLDVAVEAAQVLLWDIDFSTGALRYDAERLTWLGLDPAMLGNSIQSWLALIHPDDRDEIRAKLERAMQPGHDEFVHEYRAARRGGWVWVLTRGRVVERGADGRAMHAAGGTINVTARKLAEITSQEAADRSRLIFDESPDALMISRVSDARITDANKAYSALFGYSLEEMSGQTALSLHLWANPDHRIGFARDLLANGVCRGRDYTFQSKDGRHFVASLSAVIVQIQGVDHVINTVRDITERRAAEEANRRNEALLQSTLEAADEGILMVARSGRILSINGRFYDIWGVTPDMTAGEEDARLLAHVQHQLVDPAQFLNQVHRLYDSDEEATDTLLFKDGRVVTRFTKSLMIDGGLARIWCFKDVTLQMRSQQELEVREEIFRSIVTQAADGIVLVDMQSLAFVEFNDAACQGLGYSREEFAQLTIAHIQAEQTAPVIAENMARIATLGSVEFETRHRHKDGSVRDVRVSNRHVSLRGRDFVAAIITDITERKRVEAERRSVRRRLQATMDALPDLLFEVGMDGRIHNHHSHRPELLAAAPELFLGRRFSDFLNPAAAQVCTDAIVEALETGFSNGKTYSLSLPQGERWFELSVAPMASEVAEDRRFIFISRDITDRLQAQADMLDSEARYRTLIEGTPDAIVVVQNGRFTYANPAAMKLAGADSQRTLIGRPLLDLVHPDTHGRVLENIANFEGVVGPGPMLEQVMVRLDGLQVDVETQAIAFHFGRQPAMLIVIHDLTERRRAEERLHLAGSVFTHAREGILITSADGTIIDVNDAFTKITGYSRDEALGRNPNLLSSGRHGPSFYAALWQGLRKEGHWYGEIWNRRKNGEVYAQLLTISAVNDHQGQTHQYVALFSDITAIKEHERQLERIAHYDALTGLPNRVLLADRMRQAMTQADRQGTRLAVAYMDLDGFKAINDSHGHDAGDRMLIALAFQMKQALRAGDTVSRLGGDEFVALLVDPGDESQSVALLNRLIDAAAQPVTLGNHVLQVSASLGVSFYPQAEDVDADQLLRQADQAMYQAKLTGKGRYHVFDTNRDRRLRGQHESIDRIRKALVQGEFVLYYQPKVNMRTGALVGVEALIRWQHPERGLLPPSVFLPVIEDHPLFVEVGDWVIDTALGQIEAWQAEGLHLPVSVNVGARQLQQSDFVVRLLESLRRHRHVKPADLELEVLETSALDDIARVSKVIESCRDIGVGFALDDFGTGYSSLTYLKGLPVAQLKIDQSFVRDMLSDPDDLAILEGVLGLAKAFQRQVIAEGVETPEHGSMLLQLGCDWAQGYGIARPMPAEAIAPWAALWRPHPDWAHLPQVHREDLPLLYAGVEHRAWVAAMTSHVRNTSSTEPPPDVRHCKLGAWLEGPGRARYGHRAGFAGLLGQHERVHQIGDRLCRLHAEGQVAQSREGLDELHQARDVLLQRLQSLTQA